MSVIVELSIRSTEFELGRVLDLQSATKIELEAMVPLGEDAVPLLLVHGNGEAFVAAVETHPSVESVCTLDALKDKVRLSLDWKAGTDEFLCDIIDNEGFLLAAWGADGEWHLKIRFPAHRALSSFRAACEEKGVSLDIERVHSPEGADAGPGYGLTDVQRETLIIAVNDGYYDIPRECTTVELAEKLGVSDQAVTERLRRAIVSLVTHTLIAAEN